VLPSGLLSAAESVNWRPRRDRAKKVLQSGNCVIMYESSLPFLLSLSLYFFRCIDEDLLVPSICTRTSRRVDCDVKAAVQKYATSFLLKAVPCEAHNRVSLMMYYYDASLENEILRRDVPASEDTLKWSIIGIDSITFSA